MSTRNTYDHLFSHLCALKWTLSYISSMNFQIVFQNLLLIFWYFQIKLKTLLTVSTFVQMFAPGWVGLDIRLRISHSNLVHRTEETVRNQFEVSMPKKYFSSLMVKNKLPGKYMFHIVNSLQNYYNTEQPQPNFVNWYQLIIRFPKYLSIFFI